MDVSLLNPDDLLSQEQDPDQALLEFTTQLPEWLGTTSTGVRGEYLRHLTRFHAAASRLEAHLDEVLPSFEDFIRQQLAMRIMDDLSADIDPDAVIVDLPETVRRDYDIDPQFGSLKRGAPWIASAKRVRLSISELARQNVDPDDEQMTQRLVFSQLDYPAQLAPVAGLNGEYLHRMVMQMDVVQRYRTLLSEVFNLPPMASAQAQLTAEILLEPYERDILLEGFVAFQRKRLGDESYRLLKLAARARSRAETDAAQVQMHWVVLNPGSSSSGETRSHTLSGLSVIHHLPSLRTLIYLPHAPSDRSLIEAGSLQEAKDILIQRLISDPELVGYLATRTLDHANHGRHVSYIQQSLARSFGGFILFAPALDLQVAAQQLQTRAWLLYEQTQANARSNRDLQRQRNTQQNQRYLMYFKALLAFLPGLGTLISLDDGLRDAQSAGQAIRGGNKDDALLLAASFALSVVDVLMSVMPGAATLSVLAKTGRRVARLKPASSIARRYVIQPFDGYGADVSLADAIRQSGRDSGTWLKDGQLWIQRRGETYPVYRRNGEQTLRLKKTAEKGYEPPVRLQDGAWVYHTDVGLKGGIRSKIAETLIVEAKAKPDFRTRQARQLLDEFEFPADSQRRLELDVAVHYQSHQTTPRWAEAYRRPAPAASTSPSPVSAGVKRKESPVMDSERQSRPLQPGAGGGSSAVEMPFRGPDAWKNRGRQLEDLTVLDQIETQPPIYRVANSVDESVQIDGLTYDILPSGSSRHPSIVFLKHPATRGEGFAGFNEILLFNRHSQPSMASFSGGQWTVHGPLFSREIQDLVQICHPSLSPATCRILAEKLFYQSDLGSQGVTATRLINIKATLNTWRRGGPSSLAGLDDPLLMLEGSRYTGHDTLLPRMSVSYGPSLENFSRIDFMVDDAYLMGLLDNATSLAGVASGSKASLRSLMSAVLVKAGYQLIPGDEAALRIRSVLVFRRADQEHVYLLHMRRFTKAYCSFKVSDMHGPLPMSEAWISEWLSTSPLKGALSEVVSARRKGKLVKLIGGTNISSSSETGTQVFVNRLAENP